jgi:hypothetical protein
MAIKEGYRTFHKNKVMDMMNKVFREHNNYGAAPCVLVLCNLTQVKR